MSLFFSPSTYHNCYAAMAPPARRPWAGPDYIESENMLIQVHIYMIYIRRPAGVSSGCSLLMSMMSMVNFTYQQFKPNCPCHCTPHKGNQMLISLPLFLSSRNRSWSSPCTQQLQSTLRLSPNLRDHDRRDRIIQHLLAKSALPLPHTTHGLCYITSIPLIQH